jgi:hypothetical protein
MTNMQIGKVMTHRCHQENGGKGREEKVEKGMGKMEWVAFNISFARNLF